MRRQDRLGLILERLHQTRSVDVAELARELSVSRSSVRRDLQHLEAQQLLARTHGGAVATNVHYELPMRYRVQNQVAKRAIARHTAQLLPRNTRAIGLNGGSTTTEVARALVDRPGLRVMTNSLTIATEMAVHANLEVTVCGGTARSASTELVGPLAEMAIAQIALDVAILGVDGVSTEDGLTTQHESEAAVNRAMVQAARRVIIVADRTKFSRRGFARICPLRTDYEIVTDASMSEGNLVDMARRGYGLHCLGDDDDDDV